MSVSRRKRETFRFVGRGDRLCRAVLAPSRGRSRRRPNRWHSRQPCVDFSKRVHHCGQPGRPYFAGIVACTRPDCSTEQKKRAPAEPEPLSGSSLRMTARPLPPRFRQSADRVSPVRVRRGRASGRLRREWSTRQFLWTRPSCPCRLAGRRSS